MERLDKVVSNQTGYSRKEVKELVKNRRIFVNDEVVLRPDIKINDSNDIILLDGEKIIVRKYVYLILNKPKGYVCATEDKISDTVLDLVPIQFRYRKLFPAGRLDKDTTGLLIITDDGEFAHNILSPKKHVKKTYVVTTDNNITDEMVCGFRDGISLIDGNCKPAKLEIIGENIGIVTLFEGRYHQIKRMFGCFGVKVVELQRIGIGNLFLKDDLKLGEIRELSEEELQMIKE